MAITKRDIEKALENLDDDLRQDFISMSEQERDTVLLSLSGSNSNRLALVERWQIEFERNNRLYREKRERMESRNGDDEVNITQKILQAIKENEAAKFDWWIWFRDRVLPVVVTVGFLALLGLLYGKQLVNP